MIAEPVADALTSVEEMKHFLNRSDVHTPTPWHSASTTERTTSLKSTRIHHLLTRPDTQKLCWRNDCELTGLACWTPLAWDSEQFGFPAARIDLLTAADGNAEATAIKTNLMREVLNDGRNCGIRHLTARVDVADISAIEALQRNNFDLIDGIQTFSLRLSPDASFDKGEKPFILRLFHNEDLPQVLDLARTAYVHDRFHADSALDKETADRVNETWLRNSCSGQIADAVIIACADDTVLGYVTCRIDKEATRVLGTGCGEIGMVATTMRARNSGVASAATIHALAWFAMQGISFVEVGTQLRNIAAARLYERCGFRQTGVSLTWRKLI